MPEHPTPRNALVEPLGLHLRGWLAQRPASDPWGSVVRDWLQTPGAAALIQAVEARQSQAITVFPGDVLRALSLTPLHAVRVLILGQDPYHGPEQAQGLAFSVPAASRLPPSLRNILTEVRRDLGTVSAEAALGDLSAWARQGVLLLNTSLTVEQGQAGAHARLGWSDLTDRLVATAGRAAAAQGRALVALLWGAHAQAKQGLLEQAAQGARLRVLSCNHPSPLSARRPPQPFIGCGHFSATQAHFAEHEPHLPALVW